MLYKPRSLEEKVYVLVLLPAKGSEIAMRCKQGYSLRYSPSLVFLLCLGSAEFVASSSFPSGYPGGIFIAHHRQGHVRRQGLFSSNASFDIVGPSLQDGIKIGHRGFPPPHAGQNSSPQTQGPRRFFGCDRAVQVVQRLLPALSHFFDRVFSISQATISIVYRNESFSCPGTNPPVVRSFCHTVTSI